MTESGRLDLSSKSSLFKYFRYRQYSSSLLEIAGAEVVGSNPTLSISFILVNYGIVLNSILITVEKKASNANAVSPTCLTFCPKKVEILQEVSDNHIHERTQPILTILR